MKMVTKNKALLIIGIMLFILGQVEVNYLIYKNKNGQEIPKVKLKGQENKNNAYAIMLQQDDGTYKETDSTSFNQIGYDFNSEKSGCIDANGNKIENALSYNDSTKSVGLRINSTAYCYIYFDIKPSDIKITIKTDGVSGTLPTTSGYKNTFTCSKGTATFNNKYQRLEITNAKADCTLNYVDDTTYHTSLIDIVQNASGIVNESDAGYRYEGANPNNYIWFNNEMWRIIGSIPTKVDSSGTITKLIKIIRNESLGAIAYDAKSSGYTGAWGSNTLFTVLNDYYYGKHDATNTEYCYGNEYKARLKCDYRVKGISSDTTDYYGRMVKNVYWNTGKSNYTVAASVVYTNEKKKQTVQGRIGLMSASDYGYAASAVDHNSVKLGTYGTTDITLSNWLFSQGYEWINIQYSSINMMPLNIYHDGSLKYFFPYTGYAYRPVVYLNEDVYVISGSGTESDPYLIGM